VDSEKYNIIFEDIKLICKKIQRSCEIRQLVLCNAGKISISSATIEYNHQNIVQALLIQKDVQLLKDIYHIQERKNDDKWFNCDIDFFKEKILSKEQNDKVSHFRDNPISFPYTII